LLPNAHESQFLKEQSWMNGKLLWAQKNKVWLWTAVDHFRTGILGWVIGERSRQTFRPLWQLVTSWRCYFYVTDGWSVYRRFIADEDHIISKTYMTRVASENTRLRHYLAQLHRSAIVKQGKFVLL
jgi:insertion element IS1 protein InsB